MIKYKINTDYDNFYIDETKILNKNNIKYNKDYLFILYKKYNMYILISIIIDNNSFLIYFCKDNILHTHKYLFDDLYYIDKYFIICQSNEEKFNMERLLKIKCLYAKK